MASAPIIARRHHPNSVPSICFPGSIVAELVTEPSPGSEWFPDISGDCGAVVAWRE